MANREYDEWRKAHNRQLAQANRRARLAAMEQARRHAQVPAWNQDENVEMHFREAAAIAAAPMPLPAGFMALPLPPPPPRAANRDVGDRIDREVLYVDRYARYMRGVERGNNDVLGPGVLESGVRLLADQLFRQASVSKEEEEPRTRNLVIQDGTCHYQPEPDHPDSPGVYVSGRVLSPESNYFEIEILDKGASHLTLSIGVVSQMFSMDNLPGRVNDSYAFCPGDGLLFRSREVGSPFGPRAEPGDKIGCGIKFLSPSSSASKNPSLSLFFTHNGKEIGVIPLNIPPGGLFPAMSIHSVKESVRIRSGLRFIPEEDIMMMVDSCEDDWLSLHDIRLNYDNGPILEYVGRGKSVADVGLAQAKHPICTRHHYFEIEIIDPGLRCYISIGLARKDYPKNRHPGWQRGSIGYHADDGKVFAGSGAGAPFGPRCHKGDIMGCGVIFPRNYEFRSDSDDEVEPHGSEGDPYPLGAELGGNLIGGWQKFEHLSDSADDEDWWNERQEAQNGMKVNIYFTRNGNIIGKREVRIPKGGFYPTVGMMSSQEKVRVDLRPLSG